MLTTPPSSAVTALRGTFADLLWEQPRQMVGLFQIARAMHHLTDWEHFCENTAKTPAPKISLIWPFASIWRDLRSCWRRAASVKKALLLGGDVVGHLGRSVQMEALHSLLHDAVRICHPLVLPQMLHP